MHTQQTWYRNKFFQILSGSEFRTRVNTHSMVEWSDLFPRSVQIMQSPGKIDPDNMLLELVVNGRSFEASLVGVVGRSGTISALSFGG